MDFVRYTKKNRRRNNVCTQTGVSTKDALLKLRVESDLKNRIMETAELKGMSASELTRLLWVNYFERVDKKAWMEETKDW